MRRIILSTLAAFLLSVTAQTITTTDVNGNSIVEVVTFDANDVPTTSIISTILPQAGDDPGQQGPVGAPVNTPPPGTGAPPITYTYTTTDALGQTTKIVDQLTPTYFTPTTTPLSSGTIWAYSDYTAQFGTNIATKKSNAMSLIPPWRLPLTAFLFTFVASMIGGLYVLSMAY